MMKHNFDKVAKDLLKKKTTLEKRFIKGAETGMNVFLGRFTKEQLTGRKGDKGLNRISGSLAGSFSVKTNNASVKLATDSKYAHVHAHAGGFNGVIRPKNRKFLAFNIGGKTVFAKKVYIPKRLYFYEAYKDYGVSYISRGFKTILRKTLLDK